MARFHKVMFAEHVVHLKPPLKAAFGNMDVSSSALPEFMFEG
jgi:hypothetical protein